MKRRSLCTSLSMFRGWWRSAFRASASMHRGLRRSAHCVIDGADLLFPNISVRCYASHNISPEDISVELETVGDGPFSAAGADALRAITTKEKPVRFEEASASDVYVRARVLSFVRRYGQRGSADGERIVSFVNKVGEEDDGLVHSCIRLPIQLPSHLSEGGEEAEVYAHGLARTEKEAELLAAVHAERLIDLFGYHIYALPSKQAKHAAQAQKEGRYASSPDHQTTPPVISAHGIPAPLMHLQVEDETEGRTWALVPLFPGSRAFVSEDEAMLSPAAPDSKARRRVEEFFAASGRFTFLDQLRVEQVNKPTLSAAWSAATSVEVATQATIYIPPELLRGEQSAPNGEQTESEAGLFAKGMAPTKQLAVTLACMHVELMLDALHVPLFQESAKQKHHAMLAWSYGRPAPLPGSKPKKADHIQLPDPLKALSQGPQDASRLAPYSAEEVLVRQHSLLVREVQEFNDTVKGEGTAIVVLKQYLKEAGDPRAAAPFFRSEIDNRFLSTVVLPLPSCYGLRGGMGIAKTAADADMLAAMHALDTLTALGVRVKQCAEDQREWLEARLLEVAGAPSFPVNEEAAGESAGSGATNALRRSRPPPPGRRCLEHQLRAPQPVSKREAEQPSSHTHSTPAPRRTVKRAKLAKDATEKKILDSRGQNSGDGAAYNESAVWEGASPTPPPSASVYLSHRSEANRLSWDLTPDSPDGFILVCPSADQRTYLACLERSSTCADCAMYSPRLLDKQSRARVKSFFARMGRRLEDALVSQQLTAENTGMRTFTRVVIHLPVPRELGDHIALGEAPSAAVAENVACMHAELLLDYLGVCIFGAGEQQKKHVAQCEELGRFAPTKDEEGNRSPEPRLPPPLRREATDSLLWARYGKVPKAAPEVPEAETLITEAARGCGGNAEEALSSSVEPEEDHWASVTVDQIDPASKIRVQYYLACQGIAHGVEARYSLLLDRSTVMHTASLDVPLPSNVGAPQQKSSPPFLLEARGSAATKKDADALAWMHAEWMLGAAGVPLFPNLPKYQAYHAGEAEKQGRAAPSDCAAPSLSVEEMRKRAGTVAPIRLSLLGGTGSNGCSLFSRAVPQPPVLEWRSSIGAQLDCWNAYLDDCEAYILERKLSVSNGYFDVELVPRTGDSVVDRALDECEGEVFSVATKEVDSKLLLQLYCNAAGTRYPAQWRSQTVGPLTHRVSFTTVPLPGWEHVTAMGVGQNKEISQRRAALHALQMLKTMDPDYEQLVALAQSAADAMKQKVAEGGEEDDDGEAEFNLDTFSAIPLIQADLTANKQKLASKTAREKRRLDISVPAFLPKLGELTLPGKERVIALFTLCCSIKPMEEKELVFREIQSSADGSPGVEKLKYALELSVVDEEGKKWVGRGDVGGPQANREKALASLYEQLRKAVPLIAEIESLFHTQQFLDPEKVPRLAIPSALKETMHAFLEENTLGESASGAEENVVGDRAGAESLSSSTLSEAERVAKASEEQEQSASLLDRLQQKISNPAYIDTFAQRRAQLSIAGQKKVILDTIERSPVTIICGTTGCGKTTQIPQYILDAATEKGVGGACRIAVTQPRRLSAVSIAQRVAAERLEQLEDTCGYQIRFDNRPGRHITFCTTGILLRRFYVSPRLEEFNYVIIDEIHERDLSSDFILALLRDLLPQRPDLRVILMSATLQAEQFAAYFHSAPIIRVEGYVYPVQEVFLEDLAQYAREHKVVTPLLKEAQRVGLQDQWSSAPAAAVVETKRQLEESSILEGEGEQQSRYDFREVARDIDYPTIQFAIEQAVRMVDLASASVLVFLPGWEEIVRAKEILERCHKYDIITLHSSVGAEEQMRCFLPPAEGKIKVILSTNIAESGVTIDDVAAVIDIGRVKEKTFITTKQRIYKVEEEEEEGVERDGMSYSSQLVTVFASKANCMQRRGRAGRTRPGVCIRLYTKHHYDTLHAFQTPEMLRTPLDSLCLQILALRLGEVEHFLEHALEPPEEASVQAALRRLADLGAVNRAKKQLTPLGLRLAALPIEPKIGKLILLGASMGCLDTALTIAAVTQGDVFASAREHRDGARTHREHLSQGTLSDVIASVNGYNSWATSHFQKTSAEVMRDVQSRFLHVPSLHRVSMQKRQFFDILRDTGFLEEKVLVQAPLPLTKAERQKRAEVFVEDSPYSGNAANVAIVKAIIAASLFPNTALLSGKHIASTKHLTNVLASKDSVLAQTLMKGVRDAFFVFGSMQWMNTHRKNVMETVSATPLWALILFATPSMPLTYNSNMTLATVDGWIHFQITFGDFELLRKLKEALHHCLAQKYLDPNNAGNNKILAQILPIVREVLSTSYAFPAKSDCDAAEKGSRIPTSEPSALGSILAAEVHSPKSNSLARKS